MDKKKFYMTTIAYTSGKPHLETHMNLYLQMRLQDTREVRDMMYFSRQELTNTDRKSS